MKHKLFLAACSVLLILIGLLACRASAGELKLTFAGKDNLPQYPLVAPQQRLNTIYSLGNKVYLEIEHPQLIPISGGDSMLPMVSVGHKVLITTKFIASDIYVGDFIVVENEAGRYFHQVIAIKGGMYITKGLNNSGEDILPVQFENIVGIAVAILW